MSTELQLEFCSASNNSSRGYYAFIFQASFSMAFLHLHWGYPNYYMTRNPAAFVSSSPYQDKSVVFTGDHTPLSISDIGTISLSSRSGNVLHLNDAILVQKVKVSLSKKICFRLDNFVMIAKAMAS
uniref:Orf125 n=1 Tax=Batis maritima TaxID=4436 RepID=A0A068BEB9_BATMA|nr:orf125 [Batis maritima]AIC83406.1 orf125 [Batis maritima]